MLGAIAGDVIGSVYEFHSWQGNWDEFPLFTNKSRFTDDTVMTLAVVDALEKGENGGNLENLLVESMRDFGHKWRRAGYGNKFFQWLASDEPRPYNSFGNGSAMRVSPAGWAAQSLAEAEALAEKSAAVTHNHPEGIKGAQSVAGAIFLARCGKSREDIRDYVAGRYEYDLARTLEGIRAANYHFNETCQGSVPEAIIAFLESGNFEEAVRKAVWLRGDADTQAAIAGSIAEAFYGGVPEEIARETLARLDDELYDAFIKGQEYLRLKTGAEK